MAKQQTPDNRIKDPNLAYEVAAETHPLINTSILWKAGSLSLRGVLHPLDRYFEVKNDKERKQAVEDRANEVEKLLTLDVTPILKGLNDLFLNKVPHFNETEGFWGNGIESVTWSTDQTTGSRTTVLRRNKIIDKDEVDGDIGNHVLLLIKDVDQEPDLYEKSYDLGEQSVGDTVFINGSGSISTSAKLEINAELLTMEHMWQELLNNESVRVGFRSQPVESDFAIPLPK